MEPMEPFSGKTESSSGKMKKGKEELKKEMTWPPKTAFPMDLLVTTPTTKKIQKELECVVCMDIQCRAVIYCSNGHSYCQTCVDELSAEKNQCPLCQGDKLRSPIPNQGVRSVVMNLEVKCPSHLQGHHSRKRKCYWIGTLEDSKQHFNKVCNARLFPCPLGCGQLRHREEMEKHLNKGHGALMLKFLGGEAQKFRDKENMINTLEEENKKLKKENEKLKKEVKELLEEREIEIYSPEYSPV
jgi:hypothetical protein